MKVIKEFLQNILSYDNIDNIGYIQTDLLPINWSVQK